MIKGIIFDLDGVLVSTDELHYNAWKKLAEELNIHNFTKEDNEKQRGVSRLASLEIVLKKGDKTYSEDEKVKLADKKNGYYVDSLKELNQSAVLRGVFSSLTELKRRNLLLSVGSASKNAPMILEKTGLLPYMTQVSCGLDTVKSKPDPEVFVIAARKMGLDPKECLVIEDSAAGVEAAKRANMRSLGVGPYYDTLGADYEARDLGTVNNWSQILA